MPRTTSAANVYHAHRERQRGRILDSAEKLFDERGIDRVTMAEITSASGVRASTIYQYFSKKDDIVFAILEEVFADAIAVSDQQLKGATTALSKIATLLNFMADELSKNPAKVRFMAQFDAMYARDWPAERLLTLEAQLNPEGFQFFSELIREGMVDGSLRPDLNPDLTLHAVMNAVIGAQRRLASLGEKVELEYGQPVNLLYRETIRIILLGLRAEPSAPTRADSEDAKTKKKKKKKKRNAV